MNKFLKNILLILLFITSTSNLVFAKNKKSPDVRSAMAMVVHQESDKVIYQKKAYTKTSIASLTKLMTAMVLIDSGINLEDKVKAK